VTRRLLWGLLSLTCVALDYLSGPTIQFPLFYLVPISLAAWYEGRVWGVALAVALPLIRLSLRTAWDTPPTLWASVANAGIRITVFVAFAWLIARTATQMRQLRRMRQMEMMLGLCTVCGQIHDKVAGEWQPLEKYLAVHPQEFDQELCPNCRKRHVEAYDRR